MLALYIIIDHNKISMIQEGYMINKKIIILFSLIIIGICSLAIFQNSSYIESDLGHASSAKSGNLSSIIGEDLNINEIEIEGVFENKSINDSKKIVITDKHKITELIAQINKYTFDKDNGGNDDYDKYHPDEFIKRSDGIKSIRIYFNISGKENTYTVGIISVDNKSAMVMGVSQKNARSNNGWEGGYHLLDSGLYNYIILRYFS